MLTPSGIPELEKSANFVQPFAQLNLTNIYIYISEELFIKTTSRSALRCS